MTNCQSSAHKRWSQGRISLGLPETAESLLEDLHLPFVEALNRWSRKKGSTVVVGLQGCQGAGKSTLCDLIVPLALDLFQLRIAIVALDDVYLPLAARQQLARQQHPLWITRGVPGTHDVKLAIEIVENLSRGDSTTVTIPTFDKGTDDRLPSSANQQLRGPFDVVIFEGWCTGLGPCLDRDWQTPINDLERDEDDEMLWRDRIRDELQGPYQQLFQLFDHLALLKVPSWETVSLWRGQQEAKLRVDRGDDATHSMDDAALQRFLDHYERLTRWAIDSLPPRADFIADIAEDRSIQRVSADPRVQNNGPGQEMV